MATTHPAYTVALNAALECLAWSEVDYETERPIDSFDADFSDDAREAIRAELTAFIEANAGDLEGMEAEQIGHDFILTRNHHGAGFWDRGLGEAGERLTEAAQAYGELHAWVEGSTIHVE